MAFIVRHASRERSNAKRPNKEREPPVSTGGLGPPPTLVAAAGRYKTGVVAPRLGKN